MLAMHVTAQVRLLADELRLCYVREGTNHIERCAETARDLVRRAAAPYFGMKGAPDPFW